MKVQINETKEVKDLTLNDDHGFDFDFTRDFIANNGGKQDWDQESEIYTMALDEYEFWEKVIEKQNEINAVLYQLEGDLRNFVKDAIDYLYNTDIGDNPDVSQCINALATKLYEDLDAEQSEGFAEYCLQTAKQIFNNPLLYKNLEEIQDEINEIIKNNDGLNE